VVEANRHPNLVLRSEPDAGIYDAINKGLTKATGEIIGFLNADDFFADAEVLARVAKAFAADSLIDASFGDLVYVTEDNHKVVRYWKSQPYEKGCFHVVGPRRTPQVLHSVISIDSLGAGWFDLSFGGWHRIYDAVPRARGCSIYTYSIRTGVHAPSLGYQSKLSQYRASESRNSAGV
jgi:glycosyltransferase involved in cell wall biosynthesis